MSKLTEQLGRSRTCYGTLRKGKWRVEIKRIKVRAERRRAKAQPDCDPQYNRFCGYDD